jgi:hypothetical protein
MNFFSFFKKNLRNDIFNNKKRYILKSFFTNTAILNQEQTYRILFFGSDNFSVASLKALINESSIIHNMYYYIVFLLYQFELIYNLSIKCKYYYYYLYKRKSEYFCKFH